MKNVVLLTLLLLPFVLCAQNVKRSKYDLIADSLESKRDHAGLTAYFEQEVKHFPKNEEVLRWLAYSYLLSGKPELTEKYELEVLKIDPGCEPCWRNIGISYSNRGDAKKTIESLNHALELDPKDDFCYFLRGKSKEELGDKYGPLFDYNKAIEIQPGQADYFLQRSDYNNKAGLFGLALDDMNKVVELARPDAKSLAYERRSNLYSDHKMFKEALIDINQSIALDSTEPSFYLNRGKIYEGLDQPAKALPDLLRRIQLVPGDYRAYYLISRQCWKDGDVDQFCTYDHLSYEVLKKSEPANSLIKDLELEMGDACDSTQMTYYFQRSAFALSKKNYKEAISICNMTLQRFPVNGLSLTTRGDTYFAMKEYKKALIDFKAALATKPEDMVPIFRKKAGFSTIPMDSLLWAIHLMESGYHFDIAVAEYALGDEKKALEEINTALSIVVPGLGLVDEIYDTRGLFLLGQGKADQAMADFEKAIQIKPNSASYYANRALCLICRNTNSKLLHSSLSRENSVSPIVVNWMLPASAVVNNATGILDAALKDCTLAVKIDPASGYSWYVRGKIKKMLGQQDYCVDLKIANELGYPIDKEAMKNCDQQ
jgi:tetratricopeptide (TPR) repeat protein